MSIILWRAVCYAESSGCERDWRLCDLRLSEINARSSLSLSDQLDCRPFTYGEPCPPLAPSSPQGCMGPSTPSPSSGALPLPPRSASISLPNSALLSPAEHHPLSPSADATHAIASSPSTTTTASSLDEPSYFSLPSTSLLTLTPPSALEPPPDARNAESSSLLTASATTDATAKPSSDHDLAGATPRPEPPVPLPATTSSLRPKKLLRPVYKPTEHFVLSLPKPPHQLSLEDLEANLAALGRVPPPPSVVPTTARSDDSTSGPTPSQQQHPSSSVDGSIFPDDAIPVRTVAHIVRALSTRLADARARADERDRELSAALELLREQQGSEGEGRIERVLVRARASAQTTAREEGGGRWVLRCADDDASSFKTFSGRSGEGNSLSSLLPRDEGEKVQPSPGLFPSPWVETLTTPNPTTVFSGPRSSGSNVRQQLCVRRGLDSLPHRHRRIGARTIRFWPALEGPSFSPTTASA
jgi:hypothetical protein